MATTLSSCKSWGSEEKSIEQKVNTEIAYLDGELLSIVNELNNIKYSRYKVAVQEIQNPSNNSGESQSEGSSVKEGSEEKNTKEGGEENGENSGSSDSQNGSGQQSGGNQSNDKKKISSDGQSKTFSMESNNVLSRENSIDWEQLKSEVENLYTSWTTIVSDLEEIGVSKEQLNSFANNLDNVTIAIKNENKENTLDSIITLYEMLSKFPESYGADKEMNVMKTKYNLLTCYKYADTEDWEQLQNATSNLKMGFSNISNQRSDYKGKENNIRNANVIIEEISNSSNIKDKDIFFIKYKNLMQELNVILST